MGQSGYTEWDNVGTLGGTKRVHWVGKSGYTERPIVICSHSLKAKGVHRARLRSDWVKNYLKKTSLQRCIIYTIMQVRCTSG